MEIKGYLIQNQEGSYLSHNYSWFAHERFEDAWVHPESQQPHSKLWGMIRRN